MNLIICTTPLQALIASKLIEQYYANEKFFGIFIPEVENEKQRHYYHLLQSVCTKSLYICDESGAFYKILWQLARGGAYSVDKVFVASFNIALLQRVLEAISFKHFFTFDDGAANLIKNGWLNDVTEPRPKSWWQRLLMPKDYDSPSLKKLSEGHYTIFPGLPNVVNPTIPIQLIQGQLTENQKKESIRIFLGQSVYHDASLDVPLTERVLREYKIDYYFPHPKEQYHIETEAETVRSQLIFEDYFMQHLAGSPCTIYTYFSTAVLSLYKQAGIRVASLKPQRIDNESYIEAYNLLTSLGIEVTELGY